MDEIHRQNVQGFHVGSTWWIYYDEINIFMRKIFNMNYHTQYYHIHEGIIWIFVTSYFITNNYSNNVDNLMLKMVILGIYTAKNKHTSFPHGRNEVIPLLFLS